MKKIFQPIQTSLDGFSNKASIRLRIRLGLIFGLILMSVIIYFTYQYFSTASRADTPIVTYNLQTEDCKTESTASTCKISGNIGDLIKVKLYLESNEDTKLSGADLMFKYNIGKKGHLSFESQSSTTFNTTIIEEDHGVSLLHITRVNDRPDGELLGSEYFTIIFKIQQEGSSRITLITSASTIVGPNSNEPYTIYPPNQIGPPNNPDQTWDNIFNIKVTTENSPEPGETTPDPIEITLNPNPSGPDPSGGITIIPNPTGPIRVVDAKINYRIKLQGITGQPKTVNSIDMKVGLYRDDTEVDTRTISFSPQADGTWVADTEYNNIPEASNYHITVKGPKHLQKRVCANNPTEIVDGTYRCNNGVVVIKEGNNTLDFSKVYMLAGDLPLQNGIIDAVDIIYIRSNFGSQSAEVIARGDLNYDGIVDSQDYGIIINALSFKYDEIE